MPTKEFKGAFSATMTTWLNKWQMALAIAGVIGIGLHFLLGAQWPLLLIIVIGAGPLIWQIGYKVYQKDFGADILAALAIIAAVILGQYLAAVLVIIMLSVGQGLETFAIGRASFILEQLMRRMPARAQRLNDGQIESIAIDEIKIGDHIVIAPHQTSPTDGIVISGNSFMDESYLTGEPYRVAKAPGVAVISGSINGNAALVIRATKLPRDSRFAEIVKVIQEAEQKKPELRRLADQLGAIFGPITLVVATGAWIYTGDSMRFLSVLVIATPCPLLIAFPIALISAISLAARRAILIKDPRVLERLPTCTTAIFDKTGTLTMGVPVLTDIFIAPGMVRNDILRVAGSLEQYSKHPLAEAVLNAAKQLKLTTAISVSEEPGKGLIGNIDGRQIKNYRQG